MERLFFLFKLRASFSVSNAKATTHDGCCYTIKIFRIISSALSCCNWASKSPIFRLGAKSPPKTSKKCMWNNSRFCGLSLLRNCGHFMWSQMNICIVLLSLQLTSWTRYKPYSSLCSWKYFEETTWFTTMAQFALIKHEETISHVIGIEPGSLNFNDLPCFSCCYFKLNSFIHNFFLTV